MHSQKLYAQFFVEVAEIEGFGFYTIEVEDDVSSWRKNDKVVIASTDFDWEQAEVLTIESVDGKYLSGLGSEFGINVTDTGFLYRSVHHSERRSRI